MTAASAKPPLSKHVCGICGTKLRSEMWIYSQHTNQRYCPVLEFDACAKRADKRRGYVE